MTRRAGRRPEVGRWRTPCEEELLTFSIDDATYVYPGITGVLLEFQAHRLLAAEW